MTRNRFAWLAVLVLCTQVVGGAPASAGSDGLLDPTWRSKQGVAASGKQTTFTVMCPKDKPVISGSVGMSNGDVTSVVASSEPIDGSDADKKPDDGWRLVVNNDAGEDARVILSAICADKKAKLSYKQARDKAAPGQIADAVASCPVGHQVIGGGVSVSGRSRNTPVNRTDAWDGFDSDTDLDDAWAGRVFNGSKKKIEIVATAICVKPDGLVTYHSENFSVPANLRGGPAPECPGSGATPFALGGGIGPTGQNLTGIYNNGLVRLGSPQADLWNGQASNPNGTSASIRVTVICYDD